jgi:hypothetical protein
MITVAVTKQLGKTNVNSESSVMFQGNCVPELTDRSVEAETVRWASARNMALQRLFTVLPITRSKMS